jgi:hypothetical protein
VASGETKAEPGAGRGKQGSEECKGTQLRKGHQAVQVTSAVLQELPVLPANPGPEEGHHSRCQHGAETSGKESHRTLEWALLVRDMAKPPCDGLLSIYWQEVTLGDTSGSQAMMPSSQAHAMRFPQYL